MKGSVAVIGAGPAGLYAAREAARLGLNVTVFEKYGVGDKISCGEGFFDLLNLLGAPSYGVRFRVREVLLTVKDDFLVDCSNLNLWMIDRREWQKALAEESGRAGCTIYEHWPVAAEHLGRLKKEYDWVIDASGVKSVSSDKREKVRFAYTAQYTLSGDFSGLNGRLKAVTEPHYTGYYWIFPKSDKEANVGIGWFCKKTPNLSISAELKRVLRREGLEACPVLKKAGGIIPVSMAKQLVRDGTLLVGDAAGLASPLHGGGIDTACISGVLAARAIASGQVNRYGEMVRQIIGRRLELEQRIMEAWMLLDFDGLNDLMAAAFGSGLGRFGRLLRHGRFVLTQAATLHYLTRGLARASWQTGLDLDRVTAEAEKEGRLWPN